MISSHELLVLLDQCLFIDRKRERGRKMFLYNNKIKKKKKMLKNYQRTSINCFVI